MNAKEAFMYGFRMHCATEGCDEAQTRQRAVQALEMIKSAEEPGLIEKGVSFVGGLPGAAAKWLPGLGKDVLTQLLGYGLIVPPMLGIGGGYMAAKAMDQPYDTEEARMHELLAEYRRANASVEQRTKRPPPIHLV